MLSGRHIAAGLVALAIGMILSGVLVTTWQEDSSRREAAAAYEDDLDRWRERLRGCERGKVDRTANARAIRAQATYLGSVLRAASVRADVKRAARRARRTFRASATDLESRTGNRLVCARVFPRPPAP